MREASGIATPARIYDLRSPFVSNALAGGVTVFELARLMGNVEIFAEEYVEHARAPFQQSEPGEVNGPEHMREVVTWLRSQFSDIRMIVEAIVADGDLVATRVRTTGTNDGELNGVLPPTGKAFDAHQSHWFRVENGSSQSTGRLGTTSRPCFSWA